MFFSLSSSKCCHTKLLKIDRKRTTYTFILHQSFQIYTRQESVTLETITCLQGLFYQNQMFLYYVTTTTQKKRMMNKKYPFFSYWAIIFFSSSPSLKIIQVLYTNQCLWFINLIVSTTESLSLLFFVVSFHVCFHCAFSVSGTNLSLIYNMYLFS